MTTHTPGPWEWHSHAPWSVWCGNIQIAACRVMEEREGHEGHVHVAPYFETNDDRTEANAHLIAAAPSLLAALKEVMVDYRQCGMQDRQVMTVVKAAIAKAESRG